MAIGIGNGVWNKDFCGHPYRTRVSTPIRVHPTTTTTIRVQPIVTPNLSPLLYVRFRYPITSTSQASAQNQR